METKAATIVQFLEGLRGELYVTFEDRRRAELFYQQLDGLQRLGQEARRDLLAESRKHGATNLLQRIPCIGPIPAALLIALMQTPHRFRTKRQLWVYSVIGFGNAQQWGIPLRANCNIQVSTRTTIMI